MEIDIAHAMGLRAPQYGCWSPLPPASDNPDDSRNAKLPSEVRQWLQKLLAEKRAGQARK